MVIFTAFFMEQTVITSSTVVNSVVEKLREALVRGQWRSGDMLPGQRELAEQLGISRPSLREAVIVLETLGLVRSMPGKGVVVLDGAPAEPQRSETTVAGASLEDVLQLRYTLEPFIVGLVAQSISSKEVGQLRLTLMDMREALEANDSEAGLNAYIAFHEELFALTSNPIFQNVVQQTSNALKQSAEMLRNSPEHLAERLQENEAVVRAIRNKNSALASAEMRKHIIQEGLRMGITLNIPDDNLGN
jgi:GntR family transcriptional repressor for pyruvate dehydrogenase complex